MPLFFGHEEGRGTTAVQFVVMPFSAQKQRDPGTARRWVTGALAAGAVATGAAAVAVRHRAAS
jgi:hypothetical protein